MGMGCYRSADSTTFTIFHTFFGTLHIYFGTLAIERGESYSSYCFDSFCLFQGYQAFQSSKLETDWIAASPYDLQTDIYRVYVDACIHSSRVIGPGSMTKFIQTSSFKRSEPKVYSY